MKRYNLPTHREPVHPGEMLLKEFIEPMGMSQRQFALHLGWTRAKLNELIKGKRGLSYDAALDLADVFQMEVDFWVNLQTAYDLWQAMKDHKTKRPLNDIG